MKLPGGKWVSSKCRRIQAAPGVEVVLSRMPDKYRIPLKLKDIDGLSVEEVAAILDVSYSTVRWRLHKARAMFREKWRRLLRREERPNR